MEQETQKWGLPERLSDEDKQNWVPMREAARLSGLTVQRLYQIAYEEASPLVTKPFLVGKIRTELRIWRPSFYTFLTGRGIPTPEYRGRPVQVGAPA